MSIASNTSINQGVTLWGKGKTKIASNVEIGINTAIFSSSYLKIGNNTVIAANCYIIDSNHGIEKGKLIREQTSIVKELVIIGEDVWFGIRVKVLSGVRFGKGAVTVQVL